jgi:hypothetical protein
MNTQGMKCIGKGAFSTVYQSTPKKVLIKSKDNVKECMALGWFPESSMFPKIERVGFSDCGEYQYYEEKYYPKVKSLKNTLSAFDYEFYRALKDLSVCVMNRHNYLDAWREKFDTLPAKFNRRKAILQEALDGLSNYGSDICFEISPRNVAIQGKKLILLDCFFFSSDLERMRKEQKNRY